MFSLNNDRANPLFALNVIYANNNSYKFNEQNIINLLVDPNNLIDKILNEIIFLLTQQQIKRKLIEIIN